ncbi:MULTISPECIES: hypothetical protein [Planktothricoides]|uniref:Transposase n=2 Tax=Planktothricoides raciborskii TaxID=132608 RepID=A0AAU8JFC9_9CYAN|nr:MULTISPECIES: hypothetical protein [Planktothricoides]MBD2547659.1 hypothetical protein [Planktothricoides raciborskii FACHB-1370]MBD2585182.1 hypothetical protein [Planktothricoides raciborskii FACHB-1261]
MLVLILEIIAIYLSICTDLIPEIQQIFPAVSEIKGKPIANFLGICPDISI